MNEETNLSAIEERLQAEAGRWLVASGRPADSLWNEYQRRRQRTVRRRCAAAAALSASALAAVMVAVGDNEQPSPRSGPQAVAASRPQGGTPGARQNHSTAIVAVPRVATGNAPPGPIAIPFVIGDPTSGEPTVTGFYVPEEIQSIEVGELAPGEQDAVNAVLQIDQRQASDGVI